MGTFSIWHWLILLVLVIPVWAWGSIVKKAGYNFWWGLLCLVPLVNIVMLFVFAYSTWPIDRQTDGRI